ncbi:hypothetical protein K6119_03340 [Paracrocinitomix mangrovi]|uniref:hypothetical protein n=1 Tax=Paracrocinitomix mangrovi TaxID=2862509 RepID=UPI001C8DEFC1|nr:hypothetical protein [Paracrocinitomix mangrovi]UKN02549.1 hypothetical protein K6119_03340 [Paracrocinitomix mangrovi]
MRYSIGLLLILFLFSCNNDPWSSNEKDKFMTECKNEGAKGSYCACLLEKTMAKYPRYEESLDISFEEAVELSKECE